MKHAYNKYVTEYARLLNTDVGTHQTSPATTRRRMRLSADAMRGLIFAPHPDDECITGALALRLLRELKMRIENVAVTLGSRKDRRRERQQELQNACDFLGFELSFLAEGGLEKVNADARAKAPASWKQSVQLAADLLRKRQPHIIFFPHQTDANTTHIGVNLLLNDALKECGKEFCCWVCETEYWAPLIHPNLMIETSIADTADLVAALALHIGEVKRNPYHLRLPAWMTDNVRRGGELVGGQGSEPPNYTYATLYRLRKWAHGHYENNTTGKSFSANDSLETLLG